MLIVTQHYETYWSPASTSNLLHYYTYIMQLVYKAITTNKTKQKQKQFLNNVKAFFCFSDLYSDIIYPIFLFLVSWLFCFCELDFFSSLFKLLV